MTNLCKSTKSSESDKKQNAVDGKEYTRGQYNDKMMLGSKAPNNDANGLFRATHSHNPTRYSHIMVLTPHFYAYRGGSQGHSTTSVQAHVVSDLLTLTSY